MQNSCQLVLNCGIKLFYFLELSNFFHYFFEYFFRLTFVYFPYWNFCGNFVSYFKLGA